MVLFLKIKFLDLIRSVTSLQEKTPKDAQFDWTKQTTFTYSDENIGRKLN